MKAILLVLAVGCFATSAFAAKTPVSRTPASTTMSRQVENVIRKGIAKEMKFKVETSKASICGGEEQDAIFVTVFLKKMAMSENGPKESMEEFDHYAAYASEFKKMGFKAFMRDNQCAE